MSTLLDSASQFLTAEELGVRLRLKADTIVAWAREDRIPAIRLSKKVLRFRLADVLAALECERKPEAGSATE